MIIVDKHLERYATSSGRSDLTVGGICSVVNLGPIALPHQLIRVSEGISNKEIVGVTSCRDVPTGLR